MSLRSRLACAFLFAASCLVGSCGPKTNGFNPRDFDMAQACVDCDNDGYSVAQGDCNDHDPRVHPGAMELCIKDPDAGTPHPIDFDCNGIRDDFCDDDGDGYATCPGGDRRCDPSKSGPLPGGDCNDNEPFVNPGAFEVQYAVDANGRLVLGADGKPIPQGVDDNCDGQVDEPPQRCDTNLRSDGKSFAGAIEICAPWLIDAQINADSDPTARRITTHFGRHTGPRSGTNMILLSNGIADDEMDRNPDFVNPQPGTQFHNTDPNPRIKPNNKNICGTAAFSDPQQVFDMVTLTLTLKVPTNASSFTFNFDFFSSEYPEYVGGQFNDKFLALLTSKAFNGNISFDLDSNDITVNGGFLAVCKDEPICEAFPNSPVKGHTCSKGSHSTWPPELDGTGYELSDPLLAGEPNGGSTGWLTTTSQVTPGETITLEFVIFDAGDRQWDSAVLIDNFQWQLQQAMGASTIP